MTSCPGGASCARPSTVMERVVLAAGASTAPVSAGPWADGASGTGRLAVLDAVDRTAVGDVVVELVAEAVDGRRYGRDRGGAERADRGLPGRPQEARADVVRHVEQQVQVLGPAAPFQDPGQDALQPGGALAARRALAARLPGEEPHDPPGRLHDVGR